MKIQTIFKIGLILILSTQIAKAEDYSKIVEKVAPAVTNIHVTGSKPNNLNKNLKDLLDYYGLSPQTNDQFQAAGSGIIINAKEGYILTNNHVIESASVIKVSLADGREFEATKIGSDENTDIALIQIKGTNLTEIKLTNSDKIKIGNSVLAIGNPFGLGQTVTKGIISALSRSGLNPENIENFIQTDAAINSGNSGGALINTQGELVGMNSAILGAQGNIGIGFAIPANLIKNIVPQLIKYGTVKRAILGVRGQDLNIELAKTFNYNKSQGAFINEVIPNGAAANAGVLSGDIITEVNNIKIKSFNELRARISSLEENSSVILTIHRNGKRITTKVQLQGEETANKNTILNNDQSNFLAGISFKENKNGIVVSDIQSNSYGLQIGDQIITANKKKINNLNQLEKIIKNSLSIIALGITRQQTNLYIVIQK